jgi:hypothetical protein
MAVSSKSMVLLNIWKVFYLLFPNFEALNIKWIIMSPVAITWSYVAFNTLYAFVYLVLILGLTIIIFNRKTFEN